LLSLQDQQNTVWQVLELRISETPFQKTLTNTFDCEGGTAKMVESKSDALGIIAAEFPAGVRPVLTLISRIATKDCAVDLTRAPRRRKRPARNWSISCGQPSSCRRMAL
jgi:hypothetical protein